jgi:polyisoprenoid-binding protein YceI
VSFRIDPDKTHLEFSVRHMMIHAVRGTFSDVEAEILLEPDSLESAATTAKIATATVNTRDRLRDDYLTSANFFAPQSFPHMIYRSTSVRLRGKKISVSGLLTIRGRERQLILSGSYADLGSSGGKRRLSFHLKGEIDRESYDLTFHGAVETVSIVVGKKVGLDLSIEIVQT